MRYILLFFLFFLSLFTPFAHSLSSDSYLVELGSEYFNEGWWEDAEREFKKALIVNPSNKEAKSYLEKIRRRKIASTLDLLSPESKNTYTSIEEDTLKDKKEEKTEADKKAKVKIRGELISGLGFTSQDFIWKRANWDLNELDWRMRSETAFNQKENTFDPAIYDRLRLVIDSGNSEGFNFYANIAIDPWSFLGKSERINIGAGGGASDLAEIELKYWAATGYTINETVFTLEDGAAIALPEIKVQDGKVPLTTVSTTWGATLTIPELEIKRFFWPLRELWVDYSKDNFYFRIFPLGFQDQALTSDDPLRLSNHHIYWEESPWLDRWRPGVYNPTPNDFTPGEFDDQISWFTRNSEGTRLSFLRGISLRLDTDDTQIKATFASPKTLWQDYESFDTLAGAVRAKKQFSERFTLGLLNTIKLGFKENSLDADNFVGAVDASFLLKEGVKFQAEIAASRSYKDKTTDYKLKERGGALQIGIIATNSGKDILNQDYYSLSPSTDEGPFFKLRLLLTHMDEGFEPGLATYLETRKDMFWSRHIHFRDPLKYYYTGLYDEPALRWEDIEPYRIGDSIDRGRDVIGFRWEGKNFLKGKLDSLIDLRNAHYTNGKYLETVFRLENTYRMNEHLTFKFLGIYHHLPDTTAGIDPFDYDADTGQYLDNAAIEDGKDPSIKTASLGMEYKFTKWFSAYGIWEHTNDYTVAYDDFPRGILNDSTFKTETLYGKTYRKESTFLYSQGLFPLPPYPYYDIFKIGLNFNPNERLKIYLDWTRNEYELAGQIDDNINHIGIEIEYLLLDNLSLYFKYVYSRWKDLDRMADGEGVFYEKHHNFFLESKWRLNENESLIFQYGALGKGVLGEFLYDPYGGTLSTLDLQHIFRVYYRKKF